MYVKTWKCVLAVTAVSFSRVGELFPGLTPCWLCSWPVPIAFGMGVDPLLMEVFLVICKSCLLNELWVLFAVCHTLFPLRSRLIFTF